MVFQQFRPGAFPPGKTPKQPFRARFLAAGFLFAPGCFVQEVPYDPELYFMGEKSAMTVRAFTHGYDLSTQPRQSLARVHSRGCPKALG